jgi:hypothetical protein
VPLSPGAVIPRDMDSRQWSTFVSQSGIQADRSVRTFTPTNWGAFSADPTGDMSYMDFGAIVIMWTAAGFFGTSDGNNLSFQGLPAAITPANQRSIPCIIMDNGAEKHARVIIDNNGQVFFQIGVVVGANIQYSNTGFTAASTKGLVAGWTVFYAK